jgi:hypothetical protein
MPFIARPAAGQIIDPAWGTLVADAVVMRFATAAQRTSQLTAPVAGQLSALDTAGGQLEYWTGTAWAAVTGEISYTQITASVTVNTASAAGANLIVADSARTYDGSPIMIEFFAPAAGSPNVTNGQMLFNLYDGATDLGWMGQVLGSTSQVQVPVHLRRRLVPAAGSHTYRVGAYLPVVATGAGVVAGVGGPGVFPPAFLRITRA